MDRVPAAPTTLAYTSCLLRVASLGDYRKALTAVLPCYWVYERVVPKQRMVVRINGLALAASPGGYSPAVRPYGVLRTAWAIWREVPDVEPRVALSLALYVRRKGDTEVMVATRFLAQHTQW